MKVKIGNTYAVDYGYDDLVGALCTYDCLYMPAYDGELVEEHEVHKVTQVLSGRHTLEWYVRKADVHLAEPITNEIGTFYLRKGTNI
jgi:hypothetical protein